MVECPASAIPIVASMNISLIWLLFGTLGMSMTSRINSTSGHLMSHPSIIIGLRAVSVVINSDILLLTSMIDQTYELIPSCCEDHT